jgi:hypothetical protein
MAVETDPTVSVTERLRGKGSLGAWEPGSQANT